MADVVAILFCGRCFCHCFVFLADVIAIFLLADVSAIVFGWWQMLLPLWLLFLPLVGCCIFCGRCYCHLCWLMLLPYLLLCLWQMLWPLWLMLLPLIRLMWLADVICQGGRWNSLPRWMCVVRCCDHVWQMEWPMSTFFLFQF